MKQMSICVSLSTIILSACNSDPAQVCALASTHEGVLGVLEDHVPAAPWKANESRIEQIVFEGHDPQTGQVNCGGLLVLPQRENPSGEPLLGYPIHFSRQETVHGGEYVYSVSRKDLNEISEVVRFGRLMGIIR